MRLTFHSHIILCLAVSHTCVVDEEAAMDAELTPNYDEEMQDYIHHVWETEFCPAAADLLRRIESHQSHFEPLQQPNT